MSTSYRDEIDNGSNPEERLTLTCGECSKQVLTRDMNLTGEGVRCAECMAELNARYNAYKANQSRLTEPQQSQPQLKQPQQGSWPDPTRPTASTEFNNNQQSKPPVIEINVDTTYCKRHPRVETGLKCGRCGTPICPQCMVYSPVGLRCPDCEKNPVRTIGADIPASTGAAKNSSTSWQKTIPRYVTTPRHYFLAAVSALGVAVVGALAWGLLLNANIFRAGRGAVGSALFENSGTNGLDFLSLGITRSFQGSIHLFPEIALAIVTTLAISRATGERRGRGLQAIAIAGVVLGIFLSFVVLGARIYLNTTNSFPPLDKLLGSSVAAFGQMFQGDSLAIPLFWLVGLVIAYFRLNK